MKLIQIGSNSGYYDFTEIVKKHNPKEIDFLLLVEPHSEFNNNLNECYESYKPIIENVVINIDDNQKKVKFYTCDKKLGFKHSELSSLIKEHLLKHNVGLESIEEKEIECITINTMLEKYNIIDLDVLFIDVEGFDDQLIKSINFEKFNIKKIYYENLHINNNDMISFLELKGYKVNRNILMNGWSNEAIKIN